MRFLYQSSLVFATPIAYPSSLLGKTGRLVLALNPMVGRRRGLFDGLCWGETAPGPMMLYQDLRRDGLNWGSFLFRRMEKSFADVV